jgi:hypothetical protein
MLHTYNRYEYFSKYFSSILVYDLFSLYVIHNEGLCPSSGGINMLMMVMLVNTQSFTVILVKFGSLG